jgi:hypothetical protein
MHLSKKEMKPERYRYPDTAEFCGFEMMYDIPSYINRHLFYSLLNKGLFSFDVAVWGADGD